jgi:Prokaryotic dksA/traR C4-type zinc finger
MIKILCSECFEQIPKGRLDAIPGVTKCVKCVEVEPRSIKDVEIDEPSIDGFQKQTFDDANAQAKST